ncbi:MAG TPA: integrase arm-type DNA-binding domain-containing protein, partial [Thermoanaerobaculia bacterium]
MPKRLTEAVIRSLRTSQPQQDILHGRTPSAGLRLTRGGRKTFFIKYLSPTAKTPTGDPAQRRYYFGEHPSGRRGQPRYLTLKEFETAYDIFRGELAQGIDPQEQRTAVTAPALRHIPP